MLTRNQLAPQIIATTINGELINLYGLKGKKVLIKFHRFSGCPIARYQINEFIERQKELDAAGIETLVFLHNSNGKTLSTFKEGPGLHLIADRQKSFYKSFQAQFSWRALFNKASWRITFVALFHGYFPLFKKFQGGIIGIPADFLVDERNMIVDLHYGKHFGDSWSVSEVLEKLN